LEIGKDCLFPCFGVDFVHDVSLGIPWWIPMSLNLRTRSM
jgi:hypothetical protein